MFEKRSVCMMIFHPCMCRVYLMIIVVNQEQGCVIFHVNSFHWHDNRSAERHVDECTLLCNTLLCCRIRRSKWFCLVFEWRKEFDYSVPSHWFRNLIRCRTSILCHNLIVSLWCFHGVLGRDEWLFLHDYFPLVIHSVKRLCLKFDYDELTPE